MSCLRAVLLPAMLPLVAIVLFAGCEKGTREAAQRDYLAIVARNLPPAEQVAALEAFLARYPEPKTNSHLVRACSMLADHYGREGRNDIAAAWLERALRASPEDPDLMNSLGYFYATHGMAPERAVSILETAVRLSDERSYPARRRGFIRDSLAWAYRVQGNPSLAVVLLEEADRLAPGVAVIREHLADTYRALGERERPARIYLDLYLEGRATSARLRAILQEIDRGGPGDPPLGIARRIGRGLQNLEAADRREAEADGGALVELQARDGQRLRASIFLPGPERPGGGAKTIDRRPAVLLLHALGSSRRAAAPLARTLASHGLVALAVDVRGHGASVSEALPSPHQFSEALAQNLKAAGEDARAALAFLDRHPRVDRGRIGAVGAGLGALLAAEAIDGAVPRRAVALALVSPWGRAEAYQAFISNLDPRALLVVVGTEEGAASATADLLARARGPAAAPPIKVAAAGSGFDLAREDADLLERIAAFVADRLR